MTRISQTISAFFLCLLPLAAVARPVLPPDSVGVVSRQNKTFVRHLVKPGETLYGLARRYRVSVEQIMEANPSIKGALASGQEVLIPRIRAVITGAAAPEPASAPKAAAAVETPASVRGLPTDAQGNRVYKVQRGQTLFAIARKFGVTPADLQRYNKLSAGGGVRSGQTLIIEPASVAPEPTPAVAARPVVTPPTARPERDDEAEKERAREREAEREAAARGNNKRSEREAAVAPPSPTATPDEEPTRANEIIRKVTESGLAAIIDGGNSEKYLALHKTAPVGTIMMVRNIMNGQVVYVRVIGKLPDTGDNANVLIRLSKKAVAKLSTPDQRFRVETSYLPE